MKPLSQDLRDQIVAAYTLGEGSYEVVAVRFRVGKTVVGKMVRQKRELGTLQPQTHRRGRKPAVSGEKEAALRERLRKYPDATMLERRAALRLTCSEKTLWQTLRKLGGASKKVLTGRGTRSQKFSFGLVSSGTGSSGEQVGMPRVCFSGGNRSSVFEVASTHHEAGTEARFRNNRDQKGTRRFDRLDRRG